MSRPEQCPLCGSLNSIALNEDGTSYNPFMDDGLWNRFKCSECGHDWPFKFVQVVEAKHE